MTVHAITAPSLRQRLEREAMVVYRAGMMRALARISDGGSDRLATANTVAAGASTDFQLAWEEVVIFERTHPDVAFWAPDVGFDDDAKLDALFALAMAIERRDTGVAELAAVEALLA